MLTPSTTPPKPPRPEPSYPANLYEWTPDGWRFFGFAPESPAGSVPPEWEGDGDDVTALCPPGYTLVAVQPCSVYVLGSSSSYLLGITPSNLFKQWLYTRRGTG